MIGNHLKLLANKSMGLVARRKLYTEPIYPYPFRYINEKIYPSQVNYRESWKEPAWQTTQQTLGLWGMRFFWTWIFWQFFWNPGAVFGHHSFPDPSNWTDEELGIPPESVGSYKDWLESKRAANPQVDE